MTIASIDTANSIINRVAVEIGQNPVADPFLSADMTFVKLRTLLNIAGEELAIAYPWEFLIKEHRIVTAPGDTGVYDLPADFYYKINQTGWERGSNRALAGPLSPQEWTYLQGRDITASGVNVTFRISEGKFKTYPAPPPAGLDINFEYISTRWARSETTPYVYSKSITVGSQLPLYDATLISRYLKLKWLEAAGFDTTKATDDFAQMFTFLTGHDKGATILNMGGRRRYPLIGYQNIPDTGYGF